MTLHDNGDGTTCGHFTVPTLAASILRKIVEQMTALRRRQATGAIDEAPGAEAGQAPTCRPAAGHAGRDGLVDGPALSADWAHARGLAFLALLEHLPTDQVHGKVAATVLVTLDHDKLKAGLGAAGVDTGIEISAAEARRLVRDPPPEPLGSRRCHRPDQRRPRLLLPPPQTRRPKLPRHGHQ